jgi:hypothetical protein
MTGLSPKLLKEALLFRNVYNCISHFQIILGNFLVQLLPVILEKGGKLRQSASFIMLWNLGDIVQASR